METLSNLIKSEKPVLVDFYSEKHPPCRIMKPIMEELKRVIGDHAQIVLVNIDTPDNHKFVYRYKIMAVPTFMIFRQGDLLWRQSGMVSLPELKMVVENYILI